MNARGGWSIGVNRPTTRAPIWVVALTLCALGLQFAIMHMDATWREINHAAYYSFVPGTLIIDEVGPVGQQAGFRVGDQVVRLGSEPVKTPLEYRRVLGRQTTGSLLSITVAQGGNERLLIARVEKRLLSLALILRNMVGMAFILMGALVAYHSWEARAARRFFAAALTLGLFFSLQQIQHVGLVYLQIVILGLLPGLTLHFLLTYPQERAIARNYGPFLLHAPGLILMVWTLWQYQQAVVAGNGVYNAPGYWRDLLLHFGLLSVFTTVGLVNTALIYGRTASPMVKRQLRWVMMGLGCAVVAAVADVVLTLLHKQSPSVTALLLLGVVPLPFAFAFGMLRYRFLDVDLLANRGVVYGLLTAVLAAVYFSLVGVFSHYLGVASDSRWYVVIVLLSAFLIALLVNPLQTGFQSLIDRRFFREQLDVQQALIRWSRDLSTSLRFSDLGRLLLREVPNRLGLERAWLLVLQEDEDRLEPLPGEEIAGPLRSRSEVGGGLPMSIGARDSWAEVLAQSEGVILWGQREGGLSPHQPEAPLSWQQAGVCVVLPLMQRTQLVGVYLLGQKRSLDPYGRQELELLKALAAQATVSIANARMYEQIRAFSQGLEEKVIERTEELRDFVSAVYHELSTPITSMKGYSALLLSGTPGPLTERQERYLVSIRSSVDRLSRLLSDLSDVSRMERGQLQIDAGPVDLDEALSETIGSLVQTVEEKGLQVGYVIEPGCETVLGDPHRIVQILTNLVSNACRYTHAGGQVTVEARPLGGFAQILVRDTGIGIRPEDKDRIFERFFRSDDPIVQEQTGTGLGLAIARALVEMHGGQIWVESQVNQGSVFGFTLPLAEPGEFW